MQHIQNFLSPWTSTALVWMLINPNLMAKSDNFQPNDIIQPNGNAINLEKCYCLCVQFPPQQSRTRLKGRLVALFHSIKTPADQRHMCSHLHHRVAAAVAFVFGKCLNSFHAGVLWFWNRVCVRLSLAHSDLFLASVEGSVFIGWLFFWLKIEEACLQRESSNKLKHQH